jgi:hypothetical protein
MTATKVQKISQTINPFQISDFRLSACKAAPIATEVVLFGKLG